MNEASKSRTPHRTAPRRKSTDTAIKLLRQAHGVLLMSGNLLRPKYGTRYDKLIGDLERELGFGRK